MKKIALLSFTIVLLSMSGVKKTRIIFFGDSITQMGINKGGYIDQMAGMLKEKNIDEKYELIGAGIGGNKVYDLYLRLEDDVLAKKPDIVIIYVGINDVWHKTSGTGTDADRYEKFYVALVKKLQERNIKVVACTPSVIGEKKNNGNAQDADLEKYSAIVRKVAAQYNCQLVELRTAFADYEEKNNSENAESGILTTDRVHLNDKGNHLVALQMMKVLKLN